MQQINQMLLEMASGNFFYRLELSSKNDHLEAISVSLNMLAEEIQEVIRHEGYVNSNNPIIETVQMSFILNHKGQIDMANQQACQVLSVSHDAMLNKAFVDFLTVTSQITWQNTWKSLKQNEFMDTSLLLEFKSKSKLLAPKTCYISTFKSGSPQVMKTLVTIIQYTKIQDLLKTKLDKRNTPLTLGKKETYGDEDSQVSKSKPRLSFEDIRKIREGHNIIRNSLDQDFPSLKVFALQLGTNEFKLKYGFKALYGITVHRFLMEERLRKSKMMVQFTDQSLKSIAHATGFKSMAHFSRTFKKHYGDSPSNFRKIEQKNNDKDT